MTIEAGGDINAGDGGYSLSTQERYEDFAKQRSKVMNEPVTKEREQLAAVKLALEALENYQSFIEDAHILEGQWHWIDGADKAITALQSIIEQPAPVQEPVAVVTGYHGGNCVVAPTNPARLFNSGTAFYTTPPAAQQKPWVWLTEQEVMQTMSGDWTSQFYFARAIEAKLKEKNHDSP
jgi:hypothetical protein